MSSEHEGLPIVLLESAAHGVPSGGVRRVGRGSFGATGARAAR
ncbi:hypothetical protein ACFSTC_50950 [Nonomuraea ferruginea]